jgi:hypothetical protein
MDMSHTSSLIQTPLTSDKWQIILMGLGVGSFLVFVGVLNVNNVRRARKTGVVATSIKSLGPSSYDRRKNPVLYKLALGGSVLGAVVAFCVGLGFIGYAIYMLVTG